MLKATHESLNVYMKTQICLTSEPDLCALNTAGVGVTHGGEGVPLGAPYGLVFVHFSRMYGKSKYSSGIFG